MDFLGVESLEAPHEFIASPENNRGLTVSLTGKEARIRADSNPDLPFSTGAILPPWHETIDGEMKLPRSSG